MHASKKIFILIILLYAKISFANSIILLDSTPGKEMLINSLHSNTGDLFLNEIKYFAPQKNLTNCGPTSIAIALNTLKITPPDDVNYSPHHLFTQDNIFTQELINKTSISPNLVKHHGLTLMQVTSMLNTYNNIKAKAFSPPQISENQAHEIIIKAILTKNTIVIVNILRSRMDESGGGHFSPLAAYDKITDSVLFMDVSPYREYGPVWVPFHILYQAMNTKDGNNNRGFIIIRRIKG